jgi:hypothetical protein
MIKQLITKINSMNYTENVIQKVNTMLTSNMHITFSHKGILAEVYIIYLYDVPIVKVSLEKSHITAELI